MLKDYEIGDNALYPRSIKDVVSNQNMAMRLLGAVLVNLLFEVRGEDVDDETLSSLQIAIQSIEANDMFLEMNSAQD